MFIGLSPRPHTVHRAWHIWGCQTFFASLEWVFKCWILWCRNATEKKRETSERWNIVKVGTCPESLIFNDKFLHGKCLTYFVLLPFCFPLVLKIIHSSRKWEDTFLCFWHHTRYWRYNSENSLSSWNLFSNWLNWIKMHET
jgi:hypothetical protein